MRPASWFSITRMKTCSMVSGAGWRTTLRRTAAADGKERTRETTRGRRKRARAMARPGAIDVPVLFRAHGTGEDDHREPDGEEGIDRRRDQRPGLDPGDGRGREVQQVPDRNGTVVDAPDEAVL